jgi:hypothetical protein
MILKLIPGQRINFTVEQVEEVKGNFGPQIKFTGATPDDADAVLFLNVEPATRQLERIGLDVKSVIGRTVEFERIEKNGTKYTNINRAEQAPAPKPAASNVKQAVSLGGPLPYELSETGAPPITVDPRLSKLFTVYDNCLDHALAVAKEKMDASDVGSSPEAVAAMAATLFIAAKEKGLAA